MFEHPLVIQLLIFCGAALLAYLAAGLFRGTRKSPLPGALKAAAPLAVLFRGNGIAGFLARRLPKRTSRYESLISRMDGHFAAEDVYACQLSFFFYGAAAAAALAAGLNLTGGTALFIILVLPFAGGAWPVLFITRKAEQRSTQILSKLSFAIDLICSSMGAGLDFCSAVRYLVSLDSDNALRYEFQLFLRQIELGSSRVEALNHIRDRIQMPEFTRFVAAISQSLDSGSSVLDIMRIQSDEIRTARFVRAEREVAKAPIKMIIPMAVFIFPAMFVIIFTPIFLKVKDSGLMTTFFR